MSEPEAKRPRITTKLYNNELMYQKCHDMLIEETSDVQFIFEREDDVIKVPAKKAILAASSKVFNAMFNGDLAEKGDVQIADVSPAAFKEFLQFFLGQQVKLTMDNVAEVLMLIDKYDVTGCFAICVGFLKDHLTIDDIFWGLHLAVKFNLDELKEYCKIQIQKNYKTVFEKFDFESRDNDKLYASSNKRHLEIEMVNIFPHIFSIWKNVVGDMSTKIDRLENRDFFPISLSSERMNGTALAANETIIFSLDKSMVLVDIFCSKIYSNVYINFECTFEILIEEKTNLFGWESKSLYSGKITISGDKTHIKLPNFIAIKPNHIYAITFKMIGVPNDSIFTSKSAIPTSAVTLTPGVNISFPQASDQYRHSLISQLYFAHAVEN